jgi:TonB-linked SusC/RagA family outer membrane protein
MHMKNLFTRVALSVLVLIGGSMFAYAQTQVKGTVKDAAGEPVIGASVLVQGTHNGVVVDIDGTYTLGNVKVGDKIEFSCIGYTSQVVVFNGQPLNVVLAEDSELLEGTVVTALGIRKDEKKVGYAVSSVDASKLNATASPSLGTALYGKAAGVRVTTAPGGATGAISINVRGLSTITGTNQPLVIVDGVPIRNGDVNNNGYWDQQRMETNGLADINVEDIENLTILKGASATSLYGSEGANGVVLITMKKGKKNSGIHVDFNASAYADVVAYMPKMQTVFGPGDAYQYWEYYDVDMDPTSDTFGFTTSYKDRTGKPVTSFQGQADGQGAYYYYGPEYDGRDIYTPSGWMKYKAVTSNPYKNIFRTGFTQQYNVAITSAGERGNNRFSYTWMDNTPNQYNSHLGKHNFALSGTQDVTANGAVKVNYSVNYMNQSVKNRPYRISRLVTNFTGMVGSFEDLAYYRKHTVTAAGYRNREYYSSSHENPAEGWEYSPGVPALISEYFWNILGREQYETNQRLIASVSPQWEIMKGLVVKGSIATDWTHQDIRLKEHQETASAFSGYGGYYGLTKKDYQTVYGDILVNFQRNLTDKIAIDANVGYSARKEKNLNSSVGTNGGLTVENWFNLNASANKANASSYRSELLKTALYATASVSYGNWAYLEGTIRNEKTSTLAEGNNSFWYPSINGSFIFSELINLPKWWDYGKARVSYGVVGLAPEAYKAAIAYSQSSASGYVYNQLGSTLGNEQLKPETTYEWEFGLESKFFNNRLGFEASYYHKTIKDQILNATLARSAGGSSMYMNVGELTNQGIEVAVYGTPIETSDWRLDLSANIAWNRNKVNKLVDGMDKLEHSRWDNGAVYLYSFVGQKMGDIYSFDYKTDDKGNKIVLDNGYYARTDDPVKVGNAMPDLVGGFSATLSYKRLTLDAQFSYQIGGDVFNMPYQYYMHTGAIEESLPYRNAALGGLSYYLKDGVAVAYDGKIGPGGEAVRHDGVILPGVLADGSENTQIVSQEMALEKQYGWGTGGSRFYSGSIFKNTYLKCRELTLTYRLPENLIKKIRCNNLSVSVFARNPFFVYKNLPIFDAEATDGTNWANQVCIGGSTSTSRTFGVSLRANF